MEQIVRSWHRVRDPRYTGGELPVPGFGLTCSQCGVELTGAARHICPTCGLDFDLTLLAPSTKWFQVDRYLSAGLPQQVVIGLLDEAYVPYVVSHERGVLEIVGGPAPPRLRVVGEFYFDFLFLVTQESKRLAQRRSGAQNHTWTCTNCGEDNPGSFDVCWSCQQPQGE